MQLNGVAHVQLTVSDLPRARAFWQPFFALFEMKILIDSEAFYYAIGSRTGIALSPIDPKHRGDHFDQRRIGLHHLCLRARERGDVDVVHALAVKQGATIVHPPREDGFAPGYYSVLFEDPDGIRLEVNHVPGRGHLEPA